MILPDIDYRDGMVFVLDPNGRDRIMAISDFSPTAAGVVVGRYGPGFEIEYALVR